MHVEAGLRSYDRAMPEEHNRVRHRPPRRPLLRADRDEPRQLAAEGIDGDRVVVTGNTVVDAAARMLPGRRTRAAALLDRYGLEPDGFVLSTFHRPENVDDVDRLRSILAELAHLPLPVLLPLHPRTAARAGRAPAPDALGAVRVVEPIGVPGVPRPRRASARSSSRTPAGCRRRRAS